jgi:hypothetical protein
LGGVAVSFELDNLRRLGDRLMIPIPRDDEGMLGRECPQDTCLGYFKIKPGTGLTGDNLPCHCPYCGHVDGPDRFWTRDQIEYAKSIALRKITDAFRADLKRLEFDHKPQGAFGIGMSLKLQPGTPIPLHQYREKQLETQLTCEGCSLQYAIYGVFGFCPDCGQHNSLQILRVNLELARKELSLAATQQDPALAAHLVEDALENCVSAFDGYAREACRVRASKATDPEKAASVSFQHLPRAADRVRTLFGIRLDSTVTPADWADARLAFSRRHLLAHKAGVIDQQYLDQTGEPHELLGRRIQVAPADVEHLIDVVLAIGTGLNGVLPKP